MASITCNMASSQFGKSQHIWILVLCTAAVLCGLAAHLVTDATCGSPDLILADQYAQENNLAGLQFATCSLLAVMALPMLVLAVILSTLVSPLSKVLPTRLIWFSLPPVHPPTSLH